VGLARKQSEHAPGVVRVCGLAVDDLLKPHDGVGADDETLRKSRGDVLRFCKGVVLDDLFDANVKWMDLGDAAWDYFDS
jgi:hypothetical protein